MKYSEKVERRPDKIAAVRHPEKVGCRPDRMAAVRHPDKVERWPDPDVICPGGMSDATCRNGEEATLQFLGRIPQCPLLYRMSGPVRKGEIKMLPLQNFSFIGSIALDWLRSKGRVEGFHLRFANVRPIFVGF